MARPFPLPDLSPSRARFRAALFPALILALAFVFTLLPLAAQTGRLVVPEEIPPPIEAHAAEAAAGAVSTPKSDAPGLSYERVISAAFLEPEIRASEPNAVILGVLQYAPDGEGKYRVTPNAGETLPDEIYLALETMWIEPATPPGQAKPVPVQPGRILLTEVTGDVQVSSPFKEVAMIPGVDGMILSSGASIKTADGASAVALLAGSQSVRLGPGSQARIDQSLKKKTYVTEVDLINGIVFSRVGRPAGYKIDYQVITPQGKARATGTDYAVWLRNNRMVACTAGGSIALADPSGAPLGQLPSPAGGNLMLQGVPAMSSTQSAEWLLKTLELVKTLNVKAAPLLESRLRGEVLPEPDRRWLAHLHPVTYLIKVRRVSTPGS